MPEPRNGAGKDRQFVTALARGLEILRCFQAGDPALGNQDIAERTGLPVLVNTSFNVHEEPIINAPEECARALAEDRIDYVATANGVYGPAERL